jgi:hypothetical protein
MSVELRCEKRLHGVLTDDGQVEIACRSALCGHEPGVLVVHRFDAVTGEFLGTTKYRDAVILKGTG